MLFRPRIHDPFSPFRALERWLGQEPGGHASSPALALFESDEGVLARAPLPGLTAEQISIDVDGATVTLSGTWPVDPIEAHASAQHVERPRGTFRRKLRLPFEIDSARVKARLTRGVLEVELPRVQKTPPARITVNG
jgi:HSP20 family protein